MQTKAPLFQLHELGISPEVIDKSTDFKKIYNVTGWSYNSSLENDPGSKKYATYMEACNYPFYAWQHHHEYSQFSNEPTFKANKEAEAI